MSDNLKMTQPQDGVRINVHEPYEVNWWCHALNCSRETLMNAVKAVGVSVEAVKSHLGK